MGRYIYPLMKKRGQFKNKKQDYESHFKMHKCTETGESKMSDEWIQELKCNVDRFKYLIKRGLYVKE